MPYTVTLKHNVSIRFTTSHITLDIAIKLLQHPHGKHPTEVLCMLNDEVDLLTLYLWHKGSSIYDVHKKIRFLTTLLPCPYGPTPSPLWTSTRGRHEIHTALLKWLVQ